MPIFRQIVTIASNGIPLTVPFIVSPVESRRHRMYARHAIFNRIQNKLGGKL